MSGDVDLTSRGPKAYEVAREAIERMETAAVWPTALNFELWLHLLADPSGPLALEIQRLLSACEQITDFVSEDLAQTYLPKARLHDQIRDAGDLLSQELANVAQAIRSAQKSQSAYGAHLAGASQDLSQDLDPTGLREMVLGLTRAT